MSLFPTNTFSDTILTILKTGHYLALYTAAPTVSGGGTEVTGGSYARMALTFGTITAGAMSNTVAVTFTGLPASTITHFGIISASTGGTLKVFGALNSTAAVISGDQVQFPIGSITVNLSGS